MKYIIGVIIAICIVFCGNAAALTDEEMIESSNAAAANVTMFIISSVNEQQQDGMINSSSYNNIVNDAVAIAINGMAETNSNIQPINRTVEYNTTVTIDNITMTNEEFLNNAMNDSSLNNAGNAGFFSTLMDMINSFNF